MGRVMRLAIKSSFKISIQAHTFFILFYHQMLFDIAHNFLVSLAFNIKYLVFSVIVIFIISAKSFYYSILYMK